MNQELITVIGLFAGSLTTISFLPQVIKTVKSKSVKDFSWLMLIIFWLGVLAWLAYGLLVKDLPVVVANGLTSVLVSVLLWYKIKNN